MMMRYGSVCSGIEAATVAWHGLGWEPAFFSEIEKFPSAVLAHHYPHVPNHGDMTRFSEWPDAALDVFVGGTPCQAFSLAGFRKGLADPRGNLALVYLGIVGRYRPRWVVWENVPGVLSSNGGRDFGSFVGGLGQLGYGWAYRVLDAAGFGVPQQRKRVFVVGHLGDWRPSAAVLFERNSFEGTTYMGVSERSRNCLLPAFKVGMSESARREIQSRVAIRLLTPVECERAQGFPDNHTLISYRGKPASKCPKGPRYKALGNSMAVPVMAWIGRRIQQVEDILGAGDYAKDELAKAEGRNSHD